VVVLIGDRFEALAAAIAAAYMNIPIVHLQGGEVSGSIDESARHAISKFAQFHCPATHRAAEYLIRMGERPETILSVGCPSSDIARTLDLRLSEEVINDSGSGAEIDINKPFLLCVFHPTTTEYGGEALQMCNVLSAMEVTKLQTLLLWPNIDAGSSHISKVIRQQREWTKRLRTITNLTPEDYLRVLARAACAVGNSSSFVRDAGYFGTPVVLVGNRQNGRETDEHAVRVPASPVREIDTAIRDQLNHGRYSPSTLYGDGYVSPRIADAIANVELYTQKQLAYVSEVLA
jgi:UDP-hydrolysing UDP-N-acetyl-D-glucosamine 2-epimerase